jgi:IMP dehydrogenase
MIKNNQTISGKSLDSCKFNSKEKVIRVCDSCKNESKTTVNTIFRCRKKHATTKDYCIQCACKIYNSGQNNPAKNPHVRKKISKALRGKSKSFKDGINLRRFNKKVTTNGYILEWSDKHNRHVLEHQLIMAKNLNKSVCDLDSIHHINGDKKDNRIENLCELTKSDHSKLHAQLDKIAFELVKEKIILFDRNDKKYTLNPCITHKTMKRSYGFDEIAIKQKKNKLNSRLDAKTNSEIIRGVFVDVPMIAANMSTVINADFYEKIISNGAFAILHRAQSVDKLIDEINQVKKTCPWVAASVGIDNDSINISKKLIRTGCNIIVIDVAHGYSDKTLRLANKIKKFSPSTKIVIGNTTNADIIYECYEFVDAIKVGIAQGFACETKNTAGCTEKQFSAVLNFKQISRDFGIPIISDGSIKEPADMVKAIAAGANSIMAGKIFASCPESAAEIELIDDIPKKVYAGMASRYVQEKWRGGLKPGTCPEGGVRYLDIGESVCKLLERYLGALKSGITYSGATNIASLQDTADFVKLN